MASAVTNLADHFSLNHFRTIFDGWRLPEGPFDPQGSWTQTWQLWENSARAHRLGELRLERRPRPGGAQLVGRYRKAWAGGWLACDGTVECADDALATPQRWELEHQALDRQQQAIADTRLREVGVTGDGHVLITTEGSIRRVDVKGALTLDWCLFDAVQRLHGSPPEVPFTLLDRLGRTVKPGHILRRGEPATLRVGGKRVWREEAVPLPAGTVYRPVEALEGASEVPVTPYLQFGQGILPTVWWVAASGRLLAVSSGLLIWILGEAPGGVR